MFCFYVTKKNHLKEYASKKIEKKQNELKKYGGDTS